LIQSNGCLIAPDDVQVERRLALVGNELLGGVEDGGSVSAAPERGVDVDVIEPS
jgi:hypothetical protein